MKIQLYIFACVLSVLTTVKGISQDSLTFKGQLSVWGNFNPDNTLTVRAGGRYIPTLDYGIKTPHKKLVDFEGSANIYGTVGFNPFDTAHTDGAIRPYRAWIRYSGNQFEIRLGLQKINFGSATMLRPLMWFDRIDPRDPLQLTDGVWGILGRYYFLNNTNIWLWSLYGNEKPKTWEIGKTSRRLPELGGRFQAPLPKGEGAVSYHFRMADTRELGNSYPAYSEVAENRIGLDGKWDVGIGLWFEGSWLNKNRDLRIYTNQEMLCVGMDYTIGLGKGLYTVLEHLLASYDKSAFAFANNFSFTALSLSYPAGIFDNINAICYYDWMHHNIYNFINWKKQFSKITLYLMAYLNPENYQLPQQGNTENLFAGKGIQLMLVYNH